MNGDSGHTYSEYPPHINSSLLSLITTTSTSLQSNVIMNVEVPNRIVLATFDEM